LRQILTGSCETHFIVTSWQEWYPTWVPFSSCAFFCVCCVSSEQQSFNSAAGWVHKVALCDFRLHTFMINIHKRENTHMKETRIYAAYSYNTEISHHALSLEKTIIKRNKRSWVKDVRVPVTHILWTQSLNP
jgi:hypothetical protein